MPKRKYKQKKKWLRAIVRAAFFLGLSALFENYILPDDNRVTRKRHNKD